MWPDRTQPPAVPCPLQGNSSGLTHATNVTQSRPNLLRPRAPLALAQPSRLLLPSVMALRFRVTPTQTPADQVRSRCHLLLLRDGSTTVPHRSPCLRHYPTDASLLLLLTPTHRYLILDRHCDRATPPLTPELAASDGNDPPTGTSIQRCGDTGTSDTDIRVLCPSRARPLPTDMLPRAWVPLGSVQAWSACLTFMNSLSMTAVVMQTPK